MDSTEKDNTNLKYFEQFAEQNKLVAEGLNELNELTMYLEYLGVEVKCLFNPFLARGLEIYTGSIYEIFLTDQSIKSSIGSGGRYDNAIGGMIGTNENFSTVGISFGLDVIYTALPKNSDNNKLKLEPDIDYYVVPMNTEKESLAVARFYRSLGYTVEIEMSGKKLRKVLDRANKKNITFVIIIGDEEVKRNQVKIKDMNLGKEWYEDFRFNSLE
ncbi:ATP phosphoribosyltransferase regulatory subunit [Salipaludibacillus sp. HK11]|uniref:ATP phosphoribosyltransferase regulatory subunit n=1 Tax=Salipaludibacillus sp. HK11 TaxID=3394320 RepID=UPI0039FC3E60